MLLKLISRHLAMAFGFQYASRDAAPRHLRGNQQPTNLAQRGRTGGAHSHSSCAPKAAWGTSEVDLGSLALEPLADPSKEGLKAL